VKDAQRHGVRVRAIDVARSDWLCTLERAGPEEELCIRLGLRYARGLREQAGKRIEEERKRAPFRSIADFAARALPRKDEIETLAEIGALSSLPLRPDGPHGTRRSALWQAEAAVQRGPGLFARVEPREDNCVSEGEWEVRENGRSFLGLSPLPEMDLRERVAADLRGTGITVGPHPVALERDKLRALGVKTAAELVEAKHGRRVKAGGLCIVRQRPGTAKGFVFLSLEDETGISNIVIDPATFEKNRRPILSAALLVVEGRLEKMDGVTAVKGDRFWSFRDALDGVQSRDFR
jgi:error-prone DNA polymerase